MSVEIVREIIRIVAPGLVLGLILGKFLAENPRYIRLLSPRKWFKEAKRASRKRWLHVLILPLGFGALSLVVVSYIGLITGPSISEENIFNQIESFSPLLLIFFITVLPVVEEWMFRGIILEEISNKTDSRLLGVISSSLLFAVFHLSNPGTYMTAVIPYFMGGLILGGSYLAGGLAVAALSHISYNLLLYVISLFT